MVDIATQKDRIQNQRTDRAVLRVVLVSPPFDASGGVGRLMSYVLETLSDQEVSTRHVDSRGRSSHPAWSVVPMLRTLLILSFLKARKRVDLVHINLSHGGSTIRKTAVASWCRLLRIPTVLHLHSYEYHDFYRDLSRTLQRVVRGVFLRADHVIVLGQIWADFLVQELGVPKDKLSILYNAAPGPSAPPLRNASDGSEVRLLFLGELGPRKGVPELLQALAQLPVMPSPWTITMAGNGDIAGTRRAASELGILSRIELGGWLDPEGVRRLLGSSDIMILPSHLEGSPMAIVEAFAHAVAVVSTPVGAIPEIVTHGQSGLLVPAGDVVALREAIGALCTDVRLRSKLASAGRQVWEEKLTIEAYSHQLVQVWSEVPRSVK
jgi:glycosyltransferase involved in cell wall biosynthesis